MESNLALDSVEASNPKIGYPLGAICIINGVYIGRGTALDNPFVIGRDGSRDAVIGKYKSWLQQQILAQNSGVAEIMASMTSASTLCCTSGVDNCHGEVVRDLWYEFFDTGYF